MAPRAYWKGYLKLSLVSCPVALYPATTATEKTHFHLINRKTGNRLRQQMIDSETGEVVDSDDKGRGYELSKGRYVEIDEDELEAVRIESTHTIDIDDFVPADNIDERYLDKPYYITPDGKTGADAFAVIRDAMKRKDRVALARVVLANREHVVALKPLGKGLLGTTLRYPYELRQEADYFADIPTPKVSRDMIELAAHILDSKAAKFNPAKFKDHYETALKALVKRKAAGKTIEVEPEEPRGGNVIDLMDALRRSLGKRGGQRSHAAAESKKAPRRSRTTKRPHAPARGRTRKSRARRKAA